MNDKMKRAVAVLNNIASRELGTKPPRRVKHQAPRNAFADVKAYRKQNPQVTLREAAIACGRIKTLNPNMKTQQTKEYYNHDICPQCAAESVPAENVTDQTLRGCPNCGETWFEDLTKCPTINAERLLQ